MANVDLVVQLICECECQKLFSMSNIFEVRTIKYFHPLKLEYFPNISCADLKRATHFTINSIQQNSFESTCFE